MGDHITIMSHGDIGIWIIELRKKGINNFRFKDLPKHLQIRGMTRKARGLGILKRVENIGSRSVWKFEENERIKG
jgi:hypothetical protein